MNRLIKLPLLALSLTIGASTLAPAQSAPPGRKHLYSETANPQADISSALAQAKAQHKHVILDFGGDWCGDCQVLDIYFHQQPNQALLEKSFLVVHIFVPTTFDKNVEVGAKYGIPIKKGVPALAVLDDKGAVLYSQKTGEFSDMRYMDPASVTAFLNRWKT